MARTKLRKTKNSFKKKKKCGNKKLLIFKKMDK